MLIMHEYIPRYPEKVYNIEMHMNLGYYQVYIWEVDDEANVECIFREPCFDLEDANELFAIKVNEYK